MQKTFDIVIAADAALGIGREGGLPWQLPGDMAYFKKVTCGVTTPGARNAVIMGRRTWESIPPRFRPLRDRLNIVLTRDKNHVVDQHVLVEHGLESALQAAWNSAVERVFVIGGAHVFAEAIVHPACENIYFTDIKKTFPCDTFLPSFFDRFEHIAECDTAPQFENDTEYSFKLYRSKSSCKPDRPHGMARIAT